MKRRKTIKRLVSLLLAIVLLCTLVMSASAAGTYVGVDDDDAQGNSNLAGGTWSKVYSSNLWYGEALRTACTTYGNGATKFYRWIFANPVWGEGRMGITLSVWLYHSSFTDPEATYYAYTHSYTSQKIGTVNQNTAPAGWTDFDYKIIESLDAGGSNVIQAIEMRTSLDAGSYCGADWVEATIYP